MSAGRPSSTAGARRPGSPAPIPELPTKAVLRRRRSRENRRAPTSP